MEREEQEAIEYWKTHIELLHYNTQFASEHYATILLNYIDKLQKETEKKDKVMGEIINTIINKAKIYDYHNKITAGTNSTTMTAYMILVELLEEINKKVGDNKDE